MMITTEEVLAKLTQVELALSQLYEQFAASFPAEAGFWRTLAAEEVKHADCIRQLQTLYKENKINLSTGNVSLVAVDNLLKFIAASRERCAKGELPRVNAFSMARDFETSVLEDKFCGLLNMGDATVQQTFGAMLRDTLTHKQKIVEVLARARDAH